MNRSFHAPSLNLSLFFVTIFFVAGVPALVYQVTWQRVLKLYFGVDMFSTAVVVATFMLGLGFGSLVGGWVADRLGARSIFGYAAVEGLLGVIGINSLFFLELVGKAFAGASGARLIIADSIVLLLPTTLMGMTLPLMCRILVTTFSRASSDFAVLYAANTLGSAFGCLLSAYLAIGLLGLAGTTFVAGCINILLAAAMSVLAMASPHRPREQDAPTPSLSTNATPGVGLAWICTLSFLSGFVALGYELVWYRFIGWLLHGTAYVFGTTLFFLLLGIGVGADLAKRSLTRTGAGLPRFALCQLGVAIYSLLLLLVLAYVGDWFPGIKQALQLATSIPYHPYPDYLAGVTTRVSLLSIACLLFWNVVIIFVPSVLMGIGFPCLMRDALSSVARLGRSVAGVYFFNIVGSTAGSLAVGFLSFHFLGTIRTAQMLIVLGTITALVVFLERRMPLSRFAVPSACVAFIAIAAFPDASGPLLTLHGKPRGVAHRSFEDVTGTVLLWREPEITEPGQHADPANDEGWNLSIDGIVHGRIPGGEPFPLDEDLAAALAACPAPRRILVIGLGDGLMAHTAVIEKSVERLDIVELNGSLRQAIETTSLGKKLFAHPTLHYTVDDGRHWLLAHPDEKYDVICMWPLHSMHAYYNNLYSVEFFDLIKRHLTGGGVFFCRSSDPFSTARTIANSFAHVLQLECRTYFASDSPLVFSSSRLPFTAAALGAKVTADRSFILASTANAALNRDLQPHSEYYLTYRYTPSLYQSPKFAVRPYQMPEPKKAFAISIP